MKIKGLSWNIWVDGYFDQITDFIDKAGANIIGLQEVKDNGSGENIIKHLNNLGYHHVFAPAEYTWDNRTYFFGPAVFSRYPIKSSEAFDLHREDSRAAIKADIKINGRLLHIFSIHLIHTHQQPSEIQEKEVENLIKVLPPEHAVVMGDFNATPDSNPIQKMKSVITDADPKSNPTWSVYPEGCKDCRPNKVNIKLDYIFTTPDL